MELVFNCRKNQTNDFYRNANEILPNELCLPRIRMGGGIGWSPRMPSRLIV